MLPHSHLFEDSVDGITLVQQYIESPESYITRVEFVGGEYIYSVRGDSTDGFELCPADACQIGTSFCPIEAPEEEMKFKIVENPHKELIEKYQMFLKANHIDVAGIEFISDEKGELYTYGVNTNINYNSAAEEVAQKFGMYELAKFLGRELEALDESSK